MRLNSRTMSCSMEQESSTSYRESRATKQENNDASPVNDTALFGALQQQVSADTDRAAVLDGFDLVKHHDSIMSSHLSTEEKIDRMLLAQSSSTPSLTSLDAEDTFRVTGSASAARSMKQQQQQHRRRRSHRPTTRRFKRQQKQRNVQIALSLALCFMVVWYGSECQKHPEVAESKSHHVLGFLGLLQTLLVWACLCEAQKHHYEEGAQSGPATQHATTATTSSSSPIGGALRDIAADILSLFTNTRLVQGDTVYTESAANK